MQGQGHHTYDGLAGGRVESRDRIARYCGGFEIHCPLDAGVQISFSALSIAKIVFTWVPMEQPLQNNAVKRFMSE